MINTGEAPVWTVSASIAVCFDGATDVAEYAIGFVLPTAPGEIFDQDISSNAEITRAMDRWARAGSGPVRPTVRALELRFTDAQNRIWRRDGEQVLELVSDEQA
jgi:hypothetical protein